MSTPIPFNFESETRDVLSFAARQDVTLKTKLAPMASALFVGEPAEMLPKLERIFLTARGESLTAKKSGQAVYARALGKAWNRFVDGLRYHAGPDKRPADPLTLSFPNLASGDGTLRIERNPDAAIRRKAEKEARELSESEALATFQAQQTSAQLDALRLLSPYQLADSIAAQLRAWSDDGAQHDKVIARVVTLLDGTAEPVNAEPVNAEPVNAE